MKGVNSLTHSQFILYIQQIEQGKSHKEAVEYCLNIELNVGEFLYRNFMNWSH